MFVFFLFDKVNVNIIDGRGGNRLVFGWRVTISQ